MVVILICLGVTALVTFVIVVKEKRLGVNKKIKTAISIKAIDYNRYEMSSLERIKYISIAAIALSLIGYVFFRNLYLCIALAALSLLFPIMVKKHLIKKRKSNLNLQFKDTLNSIASSLSAGRSVEGAFKAAVGDLKVLYLKEDTLIIKELEQINRKIDMNETLEEGLNELAQRADIEEITNFVDVFTICKSTGGNLVEVIKNTSKIINQKIEIKNEIDVQVAEQKLSQKILNIMPLGLLILITSGSPEYIQPLYSAAGNVVMLVVLILLAASYFIGAKIMDIKV